MKPRHKRIALIVGGLAGLGIAAALVLSAFQENLVFFYSPTQVANKEAPQGKSFRIGGLVEQGSLKRGSDGLTVTFNVTDTAKVIPVTYSGILPDLFKEGKGVVAQGRLQPDGTLQGARGPRQARRELHAARGRACARAGDQGAEDGQGELRAMPHQGVAA